MALSPFHRYQQFCTLRTHELHYSQEDVLFNQDHFAGFSSWIGELAQIVPIKSGIASKDFVKPDGTDYDGYSTRILIDSDGAILGPSALATENWRAYNFVVRDAPQEIKEKDSKLRVGFQNPTSNNF